MADQQHCDAPAAGVSAGGASVPVGSERDANDRAIMARLVARHGAPSLADYRRTYAVAGLEWPGEDVIRRRHPVADVEPVHPAA